MEITVPDIGGFTDVSVIDVLVEVGQRIEVDTPLITLETDKAAMDVPAPAAGVVRALKVRRGDKVSQGSAILLLEAEGASPSAAAQAPAATRAPATASPTTAPGSASAAPAPVAAPAPAPPAGASPTRGSASIDEVGFSRAHASPSVRKFARELGATRRALVGDALARVEPVFHKLKDPGLNRSTCFGRSTRMTMTRNRAAASTRLGNRSGSLSGHSRISSFPFAKKTSMSRL
jgi:pyruvate dehydrogenase E2 component (dihydrolipoamide acetyltransferase)